MTPQRSFRPTVAIAAFAVLSFGMAVIVFLGLGGGNVAHERASLSLWPFLALTAWSVAVYIQRAPTLRGSGWAELWIIGFVAYAVHVWFAFGGVYHWSFAAVLSGQGWLVGTMNFVLLGLWFCSAAAALFGIGAHWLHLATTVVLVVMMLVATLIFGSTTAVIAGALVALIWLGALYLRLTARPAEQIMTY